MGNDFLKRHKAIIDFNKRVVELDHEVKPVRVSFERVLDKVKISGIKLIQKQVEGGDMGARKNVCRDSEKRERV